MSKPRPFATYYSSDLRQANSTRYNARGRAATLRGALLAAVAALEEKRFRRVDVYGRSGRLLCTAFRQGKQITVTRIESNSGKIHHVDSHLDRSLSHLYHH